MTDRGREEAEMIVLKWLEDNCLHAGVAPWYGPDDAPSYLEAKYIAPLEQLIAVALSRARAAAIEEAAKIAEGSAGLHSAYRDQIAAAIRTLSQQEDGKECDHRWTTWSDGAGTHESCTVCGIRK